MSKHFKIAYVLSSDSGYLFDKITIQKKCVRIMSDFENISKEIFFFFRINLYFRFIV